VNLDVDSSMDGPSQWIDLFVIKQNRSTAAAHAFSFSFGAVDSMPCMDGIEEWPTR
jgi:hypothetical protein